jgi:hypothetical protein
MKEMEKRIASVRQTIQNTPNVPFDLGIQAQNIAHKLDDINFKLDGTQAKASWEEVPPAIMPLNNRVRHIVWGMWSSTSSPTQTMEDNYAILIEEFPPIINQLREMDTELKGIEAQLENYGAPWTPGRLPDFKK